VGKLIGGSTRGGALLAAVAVLLMMGLTIVDVTGRFFFRSPIAGAVEVIETLMVAVVFLTMGYTQRQRAHVRVDFALQRLSLRQQQIALLLAEFFALATIAFLAWGSAQSGYQSWLIREFRFGGTPVPIWPAKLLIPLGLLLLCLQLANGIWHQSASLIGSLLGRRGRPIERPR